MKKITLSLYAVALALLALPASCEREPIDEPVVPTFELALRLEYPEGFAPAPGVRVTLRNTITGTIDETTTDADGLASFTAIAGVYEATGAEERTDEVYRYLLNGLKGDITITADWSGDEIVLPLTLTTIAKPVEGDYSALGKLIIKELYIGGCQKDDGSGSFQRDPYMIIYNNSSQPATIENLAFGALFPHNAHATNNFLVDGVLTYADLGWLPSAYGAWYIPNADTLAPGEQRIIAMNGALDHTQTYRNSVNLANPAYYVAYHPESGYTNTTYHPAPSELIPTSHYLRAIRLPNVTANAWTFSVNSPAFLLFAPASGTSLVDFAANPDNLVLHGASASQVAIKVPVDWVVDGVEVYAKGEAASKKRLTPAVDVGYIDYTNAQGYTVYRNVDKVATEAILSNAGKLVYGYSLGVEATDPSGIDAEASLKNGAHIIYKDSNNTTNDFHMRSRASLRD
jgi:hypothetical protein